MLLFLLLVALLHAISLIFKLKKIEDKGSEFKEVHLMQQKQIIIISFKMLLYVCTSYFRFQVSGCPGSFLKLPSQWMPW